MPTKSSTRHSAEGHAHAVRAAEAAELSAAFQVRLQIEEHAGDAAAAEFPLHGRQDAAEVAENRLVAALADVGGHIVLQRLLVHVPADRTCPLFALRASGNP